MKKQPSINNFSLPHLVVVYLLSFLFLCIQTDAAANETVPINIGTVLDMSIFVGQMGLSCISMALSDFYASHPSYKTRIVLHNRDSGGDTVAAAASALDLLTNVKVQAIIGPVSSMEADFVISLGEKAQVPVISFTATNPSLSSIRRPHFIRATLNDSSQVNTITSVIKEFRWKEAVLVYMDDDFGKGIVRFLTDALEEINTRVSYRSVIPALATDNEIVMELQKLMAVQTRVFIVHMVPSLGCRLFVKAKEVGMISEGYAWIVTDAIANELSSIDDQCLMDAMQGVIGVKPYVPQTEELVMFTNRWKSKFHQDINPKIPNPELNIFGLWAYDSTVALAIAIEKSGIADTGFQTANPPKLLQALVNTTFIGLSGDFRFINGQLQPPPYQIVNVIGSGFKEFGFWVAQKGLVPRLNSAGESSKLGPITWPGGTTSRPKGWMIPTNGKKLRVGVPVKYGYLELVGVTKDSSTNKTKVSGYCIDVFEAVVALLPYDLPYEYIPLQKSDGEPIGTYDEMVYQVYLGNYDAIVGDVNIVGNRSNYVDFSLPFADAGVSMLVPFASKEDHKTWLFLKPLTWELWLTSFFTFIVVGMLIWFLEHRINEGFRGDKSYHVGMVLWFPFSSLVFAHREKIVNNLARFVLIIWFLFVLNLTQAYTASLTSMLTLRQLQPAVTSVSELINNKEYVGHYRGSFVNGFLKRVGFEESRMRVFGSIEECNELLAKGSKNGGISAAFHGVPYIKLFLAKYCSNYTMSQPTFKTGGLSFAFPIGSPLVPDISRAVLNVTQSEKMIEIHNRWFRKTANCPDSRPSIVFYNLDLESFWGLFLIVGIAALLAFSIYSVRFVHEHWQIVTNQSDSLTTKLRILAQRFDNKDVTYKDPDLTAADKRMGDANVVTQVTISPQASQRAITSPPSPSLSSQSEPDITFFGQQDSLTQESMHDIVLPSANAR